MKKVPLTITMRPNYKILLAKKAKEEGLAIGQYIEQLLEKEEKK